MSLQKVGTFPVSYEISTGMPGAPTLLLDLIVVTPAEKVSGNAEITQATNPPLDNHYDVAGTFTYMTVMPQNTHIMIKLTGISGPSTGLINFEAMLVLESDWKSGTANFKYRGNNGQWVSIQDAKVRVRELVEA